MNPESVSWAQARNLLKTGVYSTAAYSTAYGDSKYVWRVDIDGILVKYRNDERNAGNAPPAYSTRMFRVMN